MTSEAYDRKRDYVEEIRLSRQRKQEDERIQAVETRRLREQNKRQEKSFRASHGLLLAALTLLLFLHGSGIFLFTSGFLLTRFVLEQKSECAVPPIDIYGSHSPGSFKAGCWHPKHFEKAVVVVIDALRYDFTVPFIPDESHSEPQPYHNSIPFLYDTAVSSPQNAFLLPFLADPPTTTLQRLKGLTTGTLPTFIDAGSNFAGTAIDEDNLIAQLKTAGKNIVHLGDDTWHALFPDYFDTNLTRAYDSFNVWDLHTLDNGVIEHIFPLLQKQRTAQWDVLIAHFLGVDHAGHRYGPDHPAMTSKLQQMNDVVKRVTEQIDDQTLLIVMGDHGMDSKGDHGGESSDELEAAIWMYSKAGLFGRGSADSILPPPDAKTRPISQIDLVPSLALLLGLPIPFNNLGTPIIEAFIGSSGNDFMNLALVNRLAAAQIHRYQDEYARVRKMDSDTLAIPSMLWDAVKRAWRIKLMNNKPFKLEEWQSFAGAYSAYQEHHLRACKHLWARFDPPSMVQGVAVLATSLVLMLSLIWTRQNLVQLSASLLRKGLTGLAGGAIIGASVAYWVPSANLIRTLVFAAAMTANLGLLWATWFAGPVSGNKARLGSRPIWTWLPLLPVLLLSFGFAANSFTIWEDEILLFFLAFLGVILLGSSFRLSKNEDRQSGCFHAIIFMLSIRLASLSRLCRDEQAANCKTTFYASAASSTSAPWQLVISYVVAIVFPNVLKSYYKRTQTYHGAAPFWIGTALQLSTVLIAVFWTLNAADDGEWLDGTGYSLITLKPAAMYLAQFIFAVAIGAGGATFAYQGPHIGIDTIEIAPTDSLNEKQSANGANAEPARSQLVVKGTSNLYGAHFATLPLAVLIVPLLLVQKPMGQGALASTGVAILSLLEVIALQSSASTTDRGNLVPSATSIQVVLGPVVLALLGHFAFFKTGHQAALASIQWDAAFIPLKTIRYPWSPLLVIMNTFGGQILCAAAVPLCVLWRLPYRFTSGASTAAGTMLSPNLPSKITPDNPTGKKNSHNSKDNHKESPRLLNRQQLLSDVARAVLVHILVYAIINLFTTVWTAHLRRHLMLYRVFSPRWMVGCISLLLVEILAVWMGVGGVGYGVQAVAGVFGW